MRVLYKNKEVSYNTRKYSNVINKPSLDGHTIEGNISLDTLNLYDKPRVKKLVEATSQIRLVTSMPADPEPNVTYYIGPDERNLYDVVLVDDAKQQIRMGTTQFGQYKSGPGVNVMIDNTININTDGVSMYIDSEGNLASSLDGEALSAFIGATSSTDGTKGLVPKPMAGEQDYVLFGDSVWKSLIDMYYPIGAILISYTSDTDPNVEFTGTTWEKLSSGYCIWDDATGGGATIDETSAPNLSGQYDSYLVFSGTNGAIQSVISNHAALRAVGDDRRTRGVWTINAANSNSTYSDSQTFIQPPAYAIVAWRRTA